MTVEFHSIRISQAIDILVKMVYQYQNQLLIFQKVVNLARVIEQQDVWSPVKQDRSDISAFKSFKFVSRLNFKISQRFFDFLQCAVVANFMSAK